MRVIVCGSRTLPPAVKDRMFEALDRAVDDVTEKITVVDGGATGADTLGRMWGRERGYESDQFPALWNSEGRAAGVIRNARMLDAGADLVLAFVDKPLAESRGTAHMVALARAAGVKVRVFRVAD